MRKCQSGNFTKWIYNIEGKLTSEKQGAKKRRKRKKKKKKKKKVKEEKPLLNRRARIGTKDWKYTPPPKSKLPALPALRKPAPPIKYTGAPPPGKSKPIDTAVKLFKLRPWRPPPPPPPPPKKPPVPRLASLPRSKVQCPPLRSASEMPWSHKHKIGLSGIPGHTYFRPRTTPLPCIPPGPAKEKLPRVPAQVPVIARLDKGGNILVHVDGTQGDLPEDAKIEVTLVRGFNASLDKKPIAPRVKLVNEHRLLPKLVPWPDEYDPNAVDPDLPAPGRYPRLNTTLTQENYIRYRRIFRG
ncbi:hypothetical protein ElyMa_000457100 [Elysia marginata]|uniref:Uncharacterized protein n=1 Tax=Elysia marginata TaxID=1093978 RepID=A0AAV4FQ13_9GAST|nr:hypothetical protein ElyMa_000457100 [Elysia marginata]